ECCIRLEDPTHPGKSGPHWICDAVAIDLRHRAVYLCDVAFKLHALLKKMSAWAQHWNSITAALQRDSMVPASWRIHVWLFVPRDTIAGLDARLEDLRRTC